MRTVDLLGVALQFSQDTAGLAVEHVHLAVHACRRHHRVVLGAGVDRENATLQQNSANYKSILADFSREHVRSTCKVGELWVFISTAVIQASRAAIWR